MPDDRSGSSKAATLAAGTLLIHRSRTSKVIRATVAEAIALAASHASTTSDDRAKTVAISAVVMASRSLAMRLAAAILLARQEARAAATHRLTRELATAGVTVRPGDLGHPSSRHEEDSTHATVAADSLAVAWRSLAAAAALSSLRKEQSAAAAIAATAGPMKARADRTALTEVATAYNDEHRAAILDGMAYRPDFRDAIDSAGIVREWSCRLEACDHCWPHDGEQVPIGESYSGGDEPGYVHPRCACTDLLVSTSAYATQAA